MKLLTVHPHQPENLEDAVANWLHMGSYLTPALTKRAQLITYQHQSYTYVDPSKLREIVTHYTDAVPLLGKQIALILKDICYSRQSS